MFRKDRREWTLLIVALFLLFLVVSVAKAQEFTEGDVVGIYGTILCDTEEQLTTILVAQQTSFHEGRLQFRQLAHTRNHLGDSACAFIMRPVRMQLVARVAIIERVHDPNGSPTTVYILAVLYSSRGINTPGYIMSLYDVREEEISA